MAGPSQTEATSASGAASASGASGTASSTGAYDTSTATEALALTQTGLVHGADDQIKGYHFAPCGAGDSYTCGVETLSITAPELSWSHRVAVSGDLAVVLESLYDHGNAAAVMRTCDALGIQRVDLVTTSSDYKCDRKISIGAHKWLDVHRHYDAASCVRALHDVGYTVLTTNLEESQSIDSIDFGGKVALVFGNERDGVSAEMVSLADGNFTIPMYGFAQSFNISVAAAVALHHATSQRRSQIGRDGDLTPAQKQILRERFYRRSVKSSDLLVTELSK